MTLHPDSVVVGVFIFIVVVIAAPSLHSKLRAVLEAVNFCLYRTRRNDLSLSQPVQTTISPIDRGFMHRPLLTNSLLDMSRRVRVFPFVFLRLSGTQTSLLPSNSITNAVLPTVDVDVASRYSAESVSTEDSMMRITQSHARSLRRLRRQGWLLHFPSRRDFTPLTDRLSPPPSVISPTLVLSDVGNTHHDASSVQRSFSPRIVEVSTDCILTPVMSPMSSLLSSPMPALMAPTILQDTLRLDQYFATDFQSPLGPPSLSLGLSTLSSGFTYSEDDVAHETDIQPIESENDDSSWCLLDKFPHPPYDSDMNFYETTMNLLEEKMSSEFEPFSHLRINSTEQDREQKHTDQQQAIQYLGEPLNSRNENRLGGQHEGMKASRSEVIFRSSVCDEVHRSPSMPLALVSLNEWDGRALGFFPHHSAKASRLVDESYVLRFEHIEHT